jgi:ubiquinone/menaquinone biosynthesis C-methylase UbiE
LYDAMTRAAEEAGVREWRRALLARARGDVVEIGAGTGLNLPLYPALDGRLILAEPDRSMRRQLCRRARALGRPRVEVVEVGAERLPWPDDSVDTMVATLVLCSVADPHRSLAEIARVLRPGGALIFLEHVAHDDPRRLRWQRWLEPLWKHLAGGCHLTRRTGEAIRESGLEIEELVSADMPSAPAIVRLTIRGVARKR